MEAVLDRLNRVERQNRITRWVGMALLVAGGAVAVMGQARGTAPRPLEARKIILRDAKGKKRAELGLFPDKPALVLYDEAERATSALGTFQDVSGWALYGPREQRLAALEVSSSGPNLSMYSLDGARRLNVGVLAQGPSLGLLSANGQAKAALGMTGENAFLHLFGAKEHGGVQLYATADRSTLRFFDAGDKPRAVLGMLEKENSPGLVFNDASGTGRAFLMVSPNGASIDLVDASKKVVWHAP